MLKPGLVTILYIISGILRFKMLLRGSSWKDIAQEHPIWYWGSPLKWPYIDISVKSKSTRAVVPNVPLSKHGARLAARLFFFPRDDPTFMLLWFTYRTDYHVGWEVGFHGPQMSFSNSEILCAYDFTSLWEITLTIASGVALSKFLNPSMPQFLNFRMGLILIPTS